MNEVEQRELARRLADVSDVLDFETSLEIAQFNPARAEELIRNREETEKRQEEFARLREGMRRALREEFG
ncbi:MAG TPA: hypothetical protein VFR75_00830 [Solirubrobacterales bacterium]|nr:hypothetical protein [Solirubrobacterales bacterium]